MAKRRTQIHRTLVAGAEAQQAQATAISTIVGVLEDFIGKSTKVTIEQVREDAYWRHLLLYSVLDKDAFCLMETGLWPAIYNSADLKDVCDIANCKTGKQLKNALMRGSKGNHAYLEVIKHVPEMACDQVVDAAQTLCKISKSRGDTSQAASASSTASH